MARKLTAVVLAPLGLAVRIGLFRSTRTQGVTSILWGAFFFLYLWLGTLAIGISGSRALPFGIIAGIASTLFVYLRGSGLENPPAGQPGAAFQRMRARRRHARAAAIAAGPHGHGHELLETKLAIERGDYGEALFMLREAHKVAAAQGNHDELGQVHDLAHLLASRAGGRIGAASERLARKLH